MTMRVAPPITRKVGRRSAKPLARYVAVTPISTNTAVNPPTNATAWRTERHRSGRAPVAPATEIALS
jgi:hypothetical protein